MRDGSGRIEVDIRVLVGLPIPEVADFVRRCEEAGLNAVGALSAGIIADTLGLSWAISFVGALTFSSGTIVALIMQERPKGHS